MQLFCINYIICIECFYCYLRQFLSTSTNDVDRLAMMAEAINETPKRFWIKKHFPHHNVKLLYFYLKKNCMNLNQILKGFIFCKVKNQNHVREVIIYNGEWKIVLEIFVNYIYETSNKQNIFWIIIMILSYFPSMKNLESI